MNYCYTNKFFLPLAISMCEVSQIFCNRTIPSILQQDGHFILKLRTVIMSG